MAPRLCFSYWLLVCWLVVTVAEGQEVVTLPGGSQSNVNPTDCQIFTLTPPPAPATRNPVTRVQPITRATRNLFPIFPPRRPGVYPRFPNRPFLLPRYNHRFYFQPFHWLQVPFMSRRFFLRRKLQRGSSSEESREKRAART